MKYMIMMFGGLGASLADRSPEWIADMQAVMMRMDRELRESGEVVDRQHHLLEQSGDPHAARESYLRAATMTASLPEQRYLTRRAAMLRTPTPTPDPTGS